MKRLFSLLATMLVAGFAFAGNPEIVPVYTGHSGVSVSGHHPARYSEQTGLPVGPAAAVFDCTIKGTVTIIFNDGTKMTIKDVSITFVGVSCGQLLRELMAAS